MDDGEEKSEQDERDVTRGDCHTILSRTVPRLRFEASA